MVYSTYLNAEQKRAAFSIFDKVDGIKFLKSQSWIIANHSASHFPVAEDSEVNSFINEFQKCENELRKYIDIELEFWVLPFDRKEKRSDLLQGTYNLIKKQNKIIVMVGDRGNFNNDHNKKIIHRIFAPHVGKQNYLKELRRIISKSR